MHIQELREIKRGLGHPCSWLGRPRVYMGRGAARERQGDPHRAGQALARAAQEGHPPGGGPGHNPRVHADLIPDMVSGSPVYEGLKRDISTNMYLVWGISMGANLIYRSASEHERGL